MVNGDNSDVLTDNKVNKGVHTTQVYFNQNASQSSLTETDNRGTTPLQPCQRGLKFILETNTDDSPITNSDQNRNNQELYKMKTVGKAKTPSKIEFHLLRSKSKKCRHLTRSPRRKSRGKKSCSCPKRNQENIEGGKASLEESFLSRLKASFKPSAPKPPAEPKKEEVLSPELGNVIYYFDHGHAEFLTTTDCPPQLLTEIIANQTTLYATKFWAEIFGSIHIGMTFFITFFLQMYKFLLYSVLRPVIVGFLQMSSDYFFKPFIAMVFSSLLQPPLVFCYNLMSSVRDMLNPIAEIFDSFLKPVAGLLKSIRLVTVTTKNESSKNQTLEV